MYFSLVCIICWGASLALPWWWVACLGFSWSGALIIRMGWWCSVARMAWIYCSFLSRIGVHGLSSKKQRSVCLKATMGQFWATVTKHSGVKNTPPRVTWPPFHPSFFFSFEMEKAWLFGCYWIEQPALHWACGSHTEIVCEVKARNS